MIFQHTNRDSAVLRTRMDGSETTAIEVSCHCQRGTFRKIERYDREWKRNALVGVLLFLFPWQRNLIFPLHRDIIFHEFLARLVSHWRRLWKSPRHWFKVAIVRSIKSTSLLFAPSPLHFGIVFIRGDILTIPSAGPLCINFPPSGQFASIVRTPCVVGRLGIAIW